MRKCFIFLIVVCFFISGITVYGSDSFDVYTFKKDRVDQSLEGNRGYVTGQPKNIPEKKREATRTLIGVDVELPAIISGAEDEEESFPAEEVPEITRQAAPEAPRAKKEEPKTKGKLAKDGMEEDEWIK